MFNIQCLNWSTQNLIPEEATMLLRVVSIWDRHSLNVAVEAYRYVKHGPVPDRQLCCYSSSWTHHTLVRVHPNWFSSWSPFQWNVVFFALLVYLAVDCFVKHKPSTTSPLRWWRQLQTRLQYCMQYNSMKCVILDLKDFFLLVYMMQMTFCRNFFSHVTFP